MCLAIHSCLILCSPLYYSLPGSFVIGILQARILEWVAIPFSMGLPNPGIKPKSPTLQADSLLSELPGRSPKWAEWAPKWTFLPRGPTDGQQAHKKMFRITVIREMQIKTTMRCHLTPVRWASSKSLQTVNAGEGVERRERSCTVGGNVN